MLHSRRHFPGPAAACVSGADLLIFRVDDPPGTPRRGAVHLARVTGVAAAGGLAFVELGRDTAGCLQVGGTIRPAPGRALAVQVTRPPGAGKPARVSTRLKLPGFLLIATPGETRRAVSRRIRDPEERDRLDKVLARLSPADLGFVARTAAHGAPGDALETEAARLFRQWEELQAQVAAGGACRELLPGPPLLLRVWDELAADRPSRVILDDPEDLRLARRRCTEMTDPPVCELHSGPAPLLEELGALRAWARVAGKRHLLPGGGRLTVEPTEALVAIDVDSAQDSRHGDPEAGALAVNLEAAIAVARLVRVRDLAGTIVVDFVGQRSRGNYRRIAEALGNELRRDAARCRIVGISETGLLELNRQNR